MNNSGHIFGYKLLSKGASASLEMVKLECSMKLDGPVLQPVFYCTSMPKNITQVEEARSRKLLVVLTVDHEY